MDQNTEMKANHQPDTAVISQLEQEHRRYSEQLEALTRQPYLSEDLQLEEVRLKKLKLRIKDQLAARHGHHPSTHVA